MSRPVLIASLVLLGFVPPAPADQTIAITAAQDSFVREADPASNFGAAGQLCVAGTDSTNSLGQPRGRFDSLLKFDASTAVAAFDNAFGANRWAMTGVVLQLDESAAPDNALFPRGLGTAQVAWLSDDSWTEGAGTPNAPDQSGGSEITWQLLQSLLTTATEHPLGTIASTGGGGTHQYALSPDAAFLADLPAGGIISLHVSPISAELGFTFHSRNFGDPVLRPQILVTAAASMPGDMNCDAVVNVQDISPFIQSLLDPNGYAASFPGCDIQRADVNGDGRIDGNDVAGFTLALLTP